MRPRSTPHHRRPGEPPRLLPGCAVRRIQLPRRRHRRRLVPLRTPLPGHLPHSLPLAGGACSSGRPARQRRRCHRLHHRRLAVGQLLRARGLRSVRSPLRRPSQPAPHHDAGRLARPPAAQGLPRGGLPLMAPLAAPEMLIPGGEDVIADATRHDGTDPSKDHTMVINMGPQHPSTHGVLRLVLEIDGESVLSLAPDIGYLHTGIEKTCEAKFYQQVVPLTDRIDYLCPMTNNLAYCLAVEKLFGFEIPDRA